MTKYKFYDEYVKSTILWLDMLPKHWISGNLRWFVKIYAGGTPSKNNEEFWREGTIPWLNSGSVNQNFIIQPSAYISQQAYNKSSAKWIKKNSLVMALAGQGKTKGMVAQLGIDATCNQSMAAIVPNDKFISKYLYWWLNSNYQNIRNMSGGDLRDGLNLELLGDIECPVPPINEQQKIANFLDKETSKIDILIEKQKRLIQLLEEKRQAVISFAVTKGLNHDIKMKDSRIEWLGNVPEHWDIKKIKHVKSILPNSFVDGPFGSNLKSEHFIESGDVYVIESNFATQGKLLLSKLKTISNDHFSTIQRSEAKENDIIIAKIGAQYGKASILPKIDKRAVVSGNSLKLSLNHNIINNQYALFVLQHLKNEGGMDDIVNTTAQPALSLGSMNNLSIPLPNIDEQLSIVSSILYKISKIDDLIKATKIMIRLSHERRTALISAAVTGKIDVRNIT